MVIGAVTVLCSVLCPMLLPASGPQAGPATTAAAAAAAAAKTRSGPARGTGPLEVYMAKVQRQEIAADPFQLKALAHLQEL